MLNLNIKGTSHTTWPVSLHPESAPEDPRADLSITDCTPAQGLSNCEYKSHPLGLPAYVRDLTGRLP